MFSSKLRCVPSLNLFRFTGCRSLVQLAGRPFLAGSHGKGFPDYLQEFEENFPYIIHANDVDINGKASGGDCAQAVRGTYRDQMTKHGAVLLRGFPLGDVEPLNNFLVSLGDKIRPMSYKSGVGIRKNIGGMLWSASDEAKEFTIEGHNEMSYSSTWPTILVFGCQVPAAEGCGGHTVLVDSRKLYEAFKNDLLVEFEQKGGVRYHHHLQKDSDHAGFSWPEAFKTNDKSDVAEFLKKNGSEHYFEDDDSLSYWKTKSLTMQHHITGENVFFNQVHAMHASYQCTNFPEIWGNGKVPFKKMPYHTLFGDGTEIPDDYIQHFRNVGWKLAVGVKLQKGDVLMVDNELTQHGRISFEGDRKLMTALLQEF